MRRLRRGLGVAGLVSFALLVAAPALAHTTKNAGPYALTFGWRDEPAYTGAENAVQLFVKDAKGNPVDELGAGVTVTVSTGAGASAQTSPPMALNSAFDPDTGLGTHGEFDAPLVPTVAGTYTFHITGNINGTAVDVSAASSDKTFADVTDPTAIEFPNQVATVPQLSSAVTTLQNSLSSAQSAADAATSSASSAKTLAIVAIVVAVVLAVVAILTGRRKASAG